jgi:hypothetical protein
MSRMKSESEQVGISKDSCKPDLVELFELIAALCKIDYRNGSFDHVQLAWKRFWSEVARSMNKSIQSLIPAPFSVAENRPLTSRAHHYSIGSIHRCSPSIYRRGKDVPFIGISGLWLEDYGFNIGRKFEIYPERNLLILRLVNVVDLSDPIGLAELFPSSKQGSTFNTQRGKCGNVEMWRCEVAKWLKIPQLQFLRYWPRCGTA